MADLTPVFATNVHDDILLTIFDIITKLKPIPDRFTDERDRPLNLIRVASQVCRRWRGLLLASPWVWGRLIDLGTARICNLDRREWLEEVLRRARSSPLWIYGDVLGPSPYNVFDGHSCFVRLMQFWERIEHLSVYIHGEEITEDVQRRFLCRAPILRSFEILSPGIDMFFFLDTLQDDSLRALFGNHAPLLTKMRADQMAFKPTSPWLSNIRDINLSINGRLLTVEDIFLILQRTPFLETVSLRTIRSPPTFVRDPMKHLFPRLHLPALSSISITSTLPILATILGHLTPGTSLSTLHLGFSKIGPPDEQILSLFQDRLLYYITHCLTSRTSTIICLELSKMGFKLHDFTQSPLCPSIKEHINFDISIYRSIRTVDGLGDIIMARSFDTFKLAASSERSSPPFQSVVELKVRMQEDLPILSVELYSMLATFQRVRVLKINQDFIHILCALSCRENEQHALFPGLHTLRFTSGEKHYLGDRRLIKSLSQFLTKRRDIALPVARLDLTNCDTKPRTAHDFSALEAVVGLEVVWKSGQGSEVRYVCGTGKPEKLTFELNP